MFCPQCGAEYRGGFVECSDCHVPLVYRLPESVTVEDDLDVLIRTGLADPIAIALVKSLLEEAGIPFFVMDQSVVPRQESGNFIGWWTIRVPGARDAEVREILGSVEQTESPSW